VELTNLAVQHVRRIVNAELRAAGTSNVICGANGSGKTSLLESIHYLATARSFRTSRAREVITRGAPSLVVSGALVDSNGRQYRVGVEKTPTSTRLKLNGENLTVASAIARLMPVLTFNTESYLLLDGGPSNRRALIDRLLFHVEQHYLDVLKTYHRGLKQRNSLLRRRAPAQQVAAFEHQLDEAATQIDRWRRECVSRVNDFLSDSPLCSGIGALTFEYRRGWPEEGELLQLLERSRHKDYDSGNTSLGPHRAELRIKIDGNPAKSIVSRGQGKLIISAIISAQAHYLGQFAAERPILLIDDLAAELDRDARQRAVDSLRATQAQCFFTAIDSTDLPPELIGASRMFHVEHGVVSAA
jgi:DNA replication and repair protein RecF